MNGVKTCNHRRDCSDVGDYTVLPRLHNCVSVIRFTAGRLSFNGLVYSSDTDGSL